MASKKFTSPNGWYTMTLPIDWEEYDDGDEETCAFFNTNSWTGNLRISPLKNSNPESDMVSSLLKSTLEENKGAKQYELGQLKVVSYKKDIKQEDQGMVMYHWVAGKMNTAFLCSFTIDKEMEGSKKNDKELQLVEEIISSIRIN